MIKKLPVWLGFGLATLAGPVFAANVDLSKLPSASQQSGVTYAKDIRPIFEASCIRCHGPERPKAGLRLDSLEAALQGSKEGKVIASGQSANSKLVIAVARLDPDLTMPPEPRPGRSGGPGSKRGGRGGGNATGAIGGGSPQPPAKPLTAEQVGLVRAWIDQGAK